jgi:hypothetical protein
MNEKIDEIIYFHFLSPSPIKGYIHLWVSFKVIKDEMILIENDKEIKTLLFCDKHTNETEKYKLMVEIYKIMYPNKTTMKKGKTPDND